MYETPKFVKWADKDIIADAKTRVIKKYGIEGLKTNIDISILDFEELRDMATLVSEFGFDHELCESISYKQQKIIKDKLNAEFDRRMGEIVQIYNLMDKKFNKEKWEGECRYRLLALHNRKGYSEMTALKNTVWFMKIRGKIIDISSAFELEKVMTYGLFWEFGNEIRDVPFDESPEKFEICNLGRKKEIKAQNDFVKYVFEGNIKEAYKMIEKDIEKIIKQVIRCSWKRKKNGDISGIDDGLYGSRYPCWCYSDYSCKSSKDIKLI